MTQENLAQTITLSDFAREAESRADFHGAFELYSKALDFCPEDSPKKRLILNSLMDTAAQLGSNAESEDQNQAISWYSKALEFASSLATNPLYSEYTEAYEGRKRLYEARLNQVKASL